MEYLIDGYNVIKYSEMFSARTLELQRDKLIDFILKYNPQGNNKITIVMEDDLMIDSYSINCDESNDNWIVVKQKNYALNYVVTKNSVCLIKVRDSKSQITSKKININNLVLENTFSNYQDMQVNNLINDNKNSNKSIYIIVVIIMIFVGITVILIKKGKRSSNKTKYVKNKKNHKK